MFTVCWQFLFVCAKKSVNDFAIENEKKKYDVVSSFGRVLMSVKVKLRCLSPSTLNFFENIKPKFSKTLSKRFLTVKNGRKLE